MITWPHGLALQSGSSGFCATRPPFLTLQRIANATHGGGSVAGGTSLCNPGEEVSVGCPLHIIQISQETSQDARVEHTARVSPECPDQLVERERACTCRNLPSTCVVQHGQTWEMSTST